MKIHLLQDIKNRIATNQHWIIDNLVILHEAGSRLYGTDLENSDFDYKGVTIAPKEYWIGLPTFEQLELKIPELRTEITIYDFRKWLKLVCCMNPNVLESLFVNEKNIVIYTDKWDKIKEYIPYILNKKILYSFGGFAKSQYHKILEKQENETGRRNLVLKYGYDTKFASHSVRILLEGIELLNTHQIKYPLKDAQEIRNIKLGKYSQGDCCEWIEILLESIETCQKHSSLPDTFDYHKVNELQMSMFGRV